MKAIVLMISLCVSLSLSAQNFKVGPDLGFNLIKTDEAQIGNDFQPSWYAGLMFEYDINDWLSIKSGINYNQKIKAYTMADTSINTTFALLGLDSISGIDLRTYSETQGKHSLNFIQIPIMASLTYENFSFNIGGYVGYMFNSRTKEFYQEKTPIMSSIDIASLDPTGVLLKGLLPPASLETFTENSNTSFIESFDFGIKTGVSYTVDNIGFNVSYLYGFKDYSLIYPSTVNLNHHYFQMSVNYLFSFGKTHSFSRG